MTTFGEEAADALIEQAIDSHGYHAVLKFLAQHIQLL